jgi:hypothetical protein
LEAKVLGLMPTTPKKSTSVLVLSEMMLESTSVRVLTSAELATPLPPPLEAVFLVMVECSMTVRPAQLRTPPLVEELPEMVELVTVVFFEGL